MVAKELAFSFEDIQRLPKVEAADTLECSGNSRSLLEKKASGNPWTIGGVGNAIWGGIRLKDVLDKAGLQHELGSFRKARKDRPGLEGRMAELRRRTAAVLADGAGAPSVENSRAIFQ